MPKYTPQPLSTLTATQQSALLYVVRSAPGLLGALRSLHPQLQAVMGTHACLTFLKDLPESSRNVVNDHIRVAFEQQGLPVLIRLVRLEEGGCAFHFPTGYAFPPGTLCSWNLGIDPTGEVFTHAISPMFARIPGRASKVALSDPAGQEPLKRLTEPSSIESINIALRDAVWDPLKFVYPSDFAAFHGFYWSDRGWRIERRPYGAAGPTTRVKLWAIRPPESQLPRYRALRPVDFPVGSSPQGYELNTEARLFVPVDDKVPATEAP